jgi:hypothetical protein
LTLFRSSDWAAGSGTVSKQSPRPHAGISSVERRAKPVGTTVKLSGSSLRRPPALHRRLIGGDEPLITFAVEVEREDDRRCLAEVVELPVCWSLATLTTLWRPASGRGDASRRRSKHPPTDAGI